jgi:hypothetical protein
MENTSNSRRIIKETLKYAPAAAVVGKITE